MRSREETTEDGNMYRMFTRKYASSVWLTSFPTPKGQDDKNVASFARKNKMKAQ